MSSELFIAGVALSLGLLFFWGFRVLPQDKWQFIAALPHEQLKDGSWQAINLTYYGFFNALAHMIALSLLLILTGAVGISDDKLFIIISALMMACLPASRLLAGLIERKAHTFTVGGASFVGILLGPVVVWIVYHTIYRDTAIPWLPLLAALAIAYAVGEGVGRLACISFGCCYGKPVVSDHSYLHRLYQRYSFTFVGSTKKIAYEGGLNGQKVFPIQAITATILIGAALAGMSLFFIGSYGLSFFFTIAITQLWRFLSETFRADHRGKGSVSAYQWMALLVIPYVLVISLFLPATVVPADVQAGIQSLWHPMEILSIQLWGAVILFYTGRSRVTGARISFHLHSNRI